MNSKVTILQAALTWMLLLSPAFAQISSDGTTGSIIKLNKNRFQIEEGTIRGKTLFHSFDKFSIPTNKQAYFTNPIGINLILSRVTGKGISNINGTLGVNGSADLFLMNPNGIIFGPNASLNVNGSFLATTGSSFVFEDGEIFSASSPTSVPNFRVSVPLGIQFDKSPEAITVQSSMSYDPSTYWPLYNLKVQSGKTISLLGGDIAFRNGTVFSPSGNIEIGSVGKGSYVALKPIVEGWSLIYSDVEKFEDIIFSQWSNIKTHDYTFFKNNHESSGRISITGQKIRVSSSSVYGSADININSSESVTIDSWSGIRSFSTDDYRNNINLNTNKLNIKNGWISIENVGNGYGGKISINAKESVAISSEGGIFSENWQSPFGMGGDIEINTESLSIADFGMIETYISRYGRGGNINIISKRLNLTDGGQIHTFIHGSGTAGDINIQASDNISISGQNKYALFFSDDSIYADSGIFSTSYGSKGKTGNLSLVSKEIEIKNGAGIGVFGKGNGSTGYLDIKGENLSLDNNAYISMKVKNNKLGNLNIDIDNLLLMENQSKITYKAEGLGIGGTVNIDAPMIVAFPNEDSDIHIDAPMVYWSISGELLGLQERSQLTKMSDIVVDSEDDRELVGEYGRTTKLKVSEFSGIVVQPKKIVKGCRPGQALGDGHFVYRGKGGLPPNPYQNRTLPAVWQDLRLHNLESNSINKHIKLSHQLSKAVKDDEKHQTQRETVTEAQEIIEAKGWVKDKKGQIILTSSLKKNIATSNYQPTATC